MFILLLNLGKAFVAFWATPFPIFLARVGGVERVNGNPVEKARGYEAGRVTVFRRMILPGSAPAVVVGLRLSTITALLLLIAAETIGADTRLGLEGMNAQHDLQLFLSRAVIVLLDLPAQACRLRSGTSNPR